jgi:hypothetical protein
MKTRIIWERALQVTVSRSSTGSSNNRTNTEPSNIFTTLKNLVLVKRTNSSSTIVRVAKESLEMTPVLEAFTTSKSLLMKSNTS